MSAAASPAGRPGMLEPLRLREFRLLLGGFIVGQSMMPLQFVTAIAWIQVIADDNVVVMVAAISTIRGLGMVGFGLFGGALADRFDRRRLLIATQTLAFVANIAIAVMMWTGASDTTAVVLFFFFTALASAAHAIDGPTRNAIAPEILGPRLTPARHRAQLRRDVARDAHRDHRVRAADRLPRTRHGLRESPRSGTSARS